MNILALESSCDETAAAVVRDGRELLSNRIASQADEQFATEVFRQCVGGLFFHRYISSAIGDPQGYKIINSLFLASCTVFVFDVCLFLFRRA